MEHILAQSHARERERERESHNSQLTDDEDKVLLMQHHLYIYKNKIRVQNLIIIQVVDRVNDCIYIHIYLKKKSYSLLALILRIREK